LAVAPERELVYQQRIPVPISMWKPWNGDGVPLHLFGPGTIPVREERAAVLLCYEQLLVWPFVSSAIERPTVLVTAANDYWATGTRIPRIQKACATSWARLFGLPLLSAVND
jgi:apolipoprotein N-acyltransferase